MSKGKLWYFITPIGIGFVDEKGNIVDFFLFSKDPEECAKIYYYNSNDKLNELIEKVSKEGYEVVGEYKKPVNYLDYIVKTKLLSKEEAQKLINKTIYVITRYKLREEVSWDRIVINLADTVEDLNKIINLLYERLMEIYGLYYPELVEVYEGTIEEFADAVYNLFDREKVAERFKNYNLPKNSVGIDFDEDLINITKNIAKEIINLLELKKNIAKKIESILKDKLPNTLSITGPLILSKLLSLAGSIEKLVNFPASTIQVLGAEKALFRHLMKGTPPPKHGILFQHPLVNRAPKKIRGRIARTLAAKISIALKVDYYSKGTKDISKKLKEELEERIKKLYEELRGEK